MESKGKSDNTIVKDAIILFIITLIGGLCLGYVYEITKDPIETSKVKAKQNAYSVVFTEAKDFEETEETKEAVKEQEEVFGAQINEVLIAKDTEGNYLGHVLSITSKEGYGGDIVITLGINLKGAITGMEILSMSETAGLGAKASSEEFKSQYAGISEEIVYTKLGKSADNEIDAISGATITTRAVTNAVNAGLSFVKNLPAAE